MKTLKFIFISLILLSFFGCKKKEVEKVDKFQFEKNVINSVFLEIVDSIYMDKRIIFPPPPPRFNEKTNKIDTIGYHAELKQYWRHRDSIKKDTAKILLGVIDFVENIGELDKQQIKEYCKKLGLNYDKTKEIQEFKLELLPFKNNKKFNFQYLSKFPSVNTWHSNGKDNSLPVGAVGISRIQFNTLKNLGILCASASCGGGKCGRGFLIIIENKSGKWKIAEVIHTWVS